MRTMPLCTARQGTASRKGTPSRRCTRSTAGVWQPPTCRDALPGVAGKLGGSGRADDEVLSGLAQPLHWPAIQRWRYHATSR